MIVEEIVNVAASQPAAQFAKTAQYIHCHINGDGIHAHPDKRLAPLLIFPHVNDQIKDTQKEGAATARDQDKGRRPDFLNDWEFHVPYPAKIEQDQAGGYEAYHLLLVFGGGAGQEQPGKNAQQT